MQQTICIRSNLMEAKKIYHPPLTKNKFYPIFRSILFFPGSTIIREVVMKEKLPGIVRHPLFLCALIACVICLMSRGIYAEDSPPSYWTKNISMLADPADPAAAWMHDNAKVVSSGNFVHVFWTGRRSDLSTGYHVFHARSSDNGATFEAPNSIWQSNDNPTFGPAWNNVAIDGSHIHVVFMDNHANPKNLLYLRSVDDGNTFEPVKSIYTSDGAFIESGGLYIAAQSGTVAVAWAYYGGNVICSISDDNGLSFTQKQVSHSTEHYRSYARDLAMTGDNIYVLFERQDVNYFTTQKHLFIAGSSDGGASFLTPQKVNEKAVNDGYYATRIQDNHYSPNIAASGSTAYVVWVNNDDPGGFDGWLHPTLRVRRTTDGGATLEDSIVLKDYPAGYHHGAHFGQETIALSGTNVVVATVVGNGTWVWTSRDGTSWPSDPLQLSAGGWWPMIASDPARNSKVHIVNYRHYVSEDGGVSFTGGVVPQSHFTTWDRPQMILDAAGSVHYVAMSVRAYQDQHILYRKIAAPPSPGPDNRVLNLVNAAPRYDNMQVPATPDLNLSTAMAMEMWVRLDTDHPTGYQGNVYFAQKKSAPGLSPSFSLGLGTPGYTAVNNIKCHILKKSDIDANPVSMAIEAPFTMPRGMWTHLAMTFDSSLESENLKLFVNGTLVKTADVAGSLYTTLIDAPLIIGDMTHRPAATFQIDEFRIWNVARARADILADMNRSLSGTEDGLVSYHNFDDTTKDVTGRGNDGVLQFMETFTVRTYSVSYVAGDNGNTYGPSPSTVQYGSHGGSVIAVPDEGFHFVQWSDGVTDNPRTHESVTGNILATAQFARNYYRLSYNTENGSIAGEDLQSVAHGGSGTKVEAVPDIGYHFFQWSDGVTDNPRTDIDVGQDLSVSATMTPICVSWDMDGDGQISLADIIYYLQVLSEQSDTTP
jgi:hypothetical protein